MIRYDPKTWFDILTHAYTRRIVWRLWPALVFMGVYASAVAVAKIKYHLFDLEVGTTLHSLVGIVLGLFLVFRTNTAYDRWWEGRKLWGSLVNDTRNLALKVAAVFPDDPDERKWFHQLIAAYPFALKEHLRQGVRIADLDLPAEVSARASQVGHVPNAIAAALYARLLAHHERGRLNQATLWMLNEELRSFTQVTGACERVRNTPIPYSYSMYMKKFIFIYVVTVPFGLVAQFGYWTIPTVMFLFYIFVSVELIAEEIEDPFGTDDNDLPTDELAEKIRDSTGALLT
jgi:ion channel-forming bestrophin family protein